MITRKAHGTWSGNLKDGHGTVGLGSGVYEGPFSFSSRFENAPATNPEELLGAAHAGCFSMALSHGLSEAGFVPEAVTTRANVLLEKKAGGFEITKIRLVCSAKVPKIDNPKFQEIALATKSGCPISKALAAVPVELEASLV